MKIKIVQFGFEAAGIEGISYSTTLWALGEDGTLYAYDGNRWVKQFDCIEVEDEGTPPMTGGNNDKQD